MNLLYIEFTGRHNYTESCYAGLHDTQVTSLTPACLCDGGGGLATCIIFPFRFPIITLFNGCMCKIKQKKNLQELCDTSYITPYFTEVREAGEEVERLKEGEEEQETGE